MLVSGWLNAEGLDHWKPLIDLAAHPNVYVKVSGFAYVIEPDGARWEYPYAPVLPVIRAVAERYGAARLMWGSDYPPTMRYMTYRQSLEVVRTHCHFLSAAEKADLLGETACRVLRL
jgi:predicted TIM-barrel fold metal-dependent hydrolase